MDEQTSALEQLRSIAPRLEKLTREVEARIGFGTWDGADHLAVRMLLDELAGALRGSRLVTGRTSERLREVSDTIKKARQQLEQLDRSRDVSVNGS